ncbi:MAG: hypothetical protein KJ043_15230, partial [Anaerolineae bacterium]|nr:hypothetical protein [Anaerolineae bacterium]
IIFRGVSGLISIIIVSGLGGSVSIKSSILIGFIIAVTSGVWSQRFYGPWETNPIILYLSLGFGLSIVSGISTKIIGSSMGGYLLLSLTHFGESSSIEIIVSISSIIVFFVMFFAIFEVEKAIKQKSTTWVAPIILIIFILSHIFLIWYCILGGWYTLI